MQGCVDIAGIWNHCGCGSDGPWAMLALFWHVIRIEDSLDPGRCAPLVVGAMLNGDAGLDEIGRIKPLVLAAPENSRFTIIFSSRNGWELSYASEKMPAKCRMTRRNSLTRGYESLVRNGVSDFTINRAFDHGATKYVANGVTNFIPTGPN